MSAVKTTVDDFTVVLSFFLKIAVSKMGTGVSCSETFRLKISRRKIDQEVSRSSQPLDVGRFRCSDDLNFLERPVEGALVADLVLKQLTDWLQPFVVGTMTMCLTVGG